MGKTTRLYGNKNRSPYGKYNSYIYKDDCPDPCVGESFPDDIYIESFRVTRQVSMHKVSPITIKLGIKSTGKFSPATKLANVIGIQNGIEIYNQIISASHRGSNERIRFGFPDYRPIVAGDITWTAIIYSYNLDGDTAVAVTKVV